jgi:prepilin-type N-terminal cleavage/methylation domain-containing protein
MSGDMRPSFKPAQDGFTLIELLIAVTITAFIIGVLGDILFTGLRTTDVTTNRLNESRDNQLLGARLVADMQSVGLGTTTDCHSSTDPATLPIGVCTDSVAAHCGSGGSSLVELKWTDADYNNPTSSGGVSSVSAYRLVGAQIMRFLCRSTSPPSWALVGQTTLADSVSPSTPPAVSPCGGTVSLRVTEATGYSYTIAAERRTPGSVGGNAAISVVANQASAPPNTPVSATANLACGTNGIGGTLTSYLIGPSTNPPASCPGGATPSTQAVSGNATYTLSKPGPSVAGNYWWYATYGGDANNAPANSACGSAGSKVAINALTPTFIVSVTPAGPQTAGTPFQVQLTATTDGVTTDSSYTGSKTITWSGPPSSPMPTSKAPVLPPPSVSFVGGVSSTPLSATLYFAGANTLNATDGTRSGSKAITVGHGTIQLTFATCPTGTVASPHSFTLTRASTDQWSNPDASAISVALTHTSNKGTMSPNPATIAANATSGSFTYTRGGGSNSYPDQLTATATGYTQASCGPFTVQ